MNKNKALAIALSAGLVLGGASVAHAESDSWDGYGDSYQDAWENASREQDEKIAAENAALEEVKKQAKTIVDNNVEAGNLTKEEGNAKKAEIDEAKNKDEINAILSSIHDKYVEDQKAEKELPGLKEQAKAIVDNNVEAGNLTKEEGNAKKAEIDKANNKDEINTILKTIHDKYVEDQKKEKEEADKLLATQKDEAKKIVDNNVEAGNLTEEEGKAKKDEIDKAVNKTDINAILDSVHDKYVENQKKEKKEAEKLLAKQKESAKEIVDNNVEAGNLTEEEGKAKKDEIDKANNLTEINAILNKIHDKYVEDQKKEKEENEKLLAKQKEAAKEIVDNNVEAGNLTEEEGKAKKDEIDKANNLSEINAILKTIHDKYVEDQKAEKELADLKEAGKKIVDNNIEAGNLTKEEGEAKKAEIDKAKNKDEINAILKTIHDKYVEDQKAEKELADLKEAGKKIVDNNIEAGNIDKSLGEFYKQQIDTAESKEEINSILKLVYDEYKKNQDSEDEKKPEEGNKTTLDEWILAQNEKDGYLTKEDAIAAANLALENDPINRSYKVRQAANGNWYFVLSPVIEEPEVEEPEEEKPEDKKKQTLDEWQIEQNEKDGYFTEEDARRAGELALEKAGLEGLYKVEVRKNAVGDMWFWRFVPVEAAEEEKPSIPWTPLTPANPIKPGTPWTPIVPGETDKPGQDEDDKVVVPEEDEKDKDSKDKDSKDKEKESEESKEKEDSKDKEKSKEKSKPAKTKGNNPKTGLAGLAPIYSTLAISMAGIVAARKKND